MNVRCFKNNNLVKTFDHTDDIIVNNDELLVDGKCVALFDRDAGGGWLDPDTGKLLYTSFVIEGQVI